MHFLAITQATATWLLAHAAEKKAIADIMPALGESKGLRNGVFVAGPLRVAATADGRAVAIWHVDYLGSTGAEPWGFLRLDGPHGAVATSREEDMLRAALVVFDSRLQNLLLPANQRVRGHGNGMFTATLGAGIKRHASFGYLESQFAASRAIFVVGPQDEDGRLERSLAQLVETLKSVAPSAESLVKEVDLLPQVARGRLAVEVASLTGLRTTPVEEGEERPMIVEGSALTQVFSEPVLPISYEEWISVDSALNAEKRKILEADLVEEQPLRIVGPAGSGKSLLMQLMAVRAGKRSESRGAGARILYLVHNSAMMRSTAERFDRLWPAGARPASIELDVLTLHAYCRNRLRIDADNLLDEDAGETKGFQLATVRQALQSRLDGVNSAKCPLFSKVTGNEELLDVLSRLVVNEIGIVIKGYRQFEDRRRYVELEGGLSRLHRLLSPAERAIVFDVYRDYHCQVFEEGGFLDSDDLALDLLSHLRTQLWQLRRRADGYDYLFVDETQLYNENERRVFPYLTKKSSGNLPIAIAIDEAQSMENAATSGFALLGLPAMRNEKLHTVFRSTESILRLAFHLIQRTTDLFGPEFPNYTAISRSAISDDHAKAHPPAIHTAARGQSVFVAVSQLALRLRAQNLRQIGIITMNEGDAEPVVRELRRGGHNAVHIQHRGQVIDGRSPTIAVATAALVGGQEFDAVIIVGAESGSFPPPVPLDSLTVALEQEALRRLYLAFTRARYQAHVVLQSDAKVSRLLDTAVEQGLITIHGEVK